MRWYANELGHGGEADFWALVGLLHDVDFEQWPEQHCKKRPKLARTMRSYTRFAATAAAYSDVEPGWKWKKCYLPWTRLALMRPSKSAGYGFQPGRKNSRQKIRRGLLLRRHCQGAERLGWELDRPGQHAAGQRLRHRWPALSCRDIRSRPTNQMEKFPPGHLLFPPVHQPARVCRPASAERCCP